MEQRPHAVTLSTAERDLHFQILHLSKRQVPFGLFEPAGM